MKINKSRRGSSRNISRRKLVKRTHKKSLFRLKKYNKNIKRRKHYTRKVNRCKRGGRRGIFNFSFPVVYEKTTDGESKEIIMDGNNKDSKKVSTIVAGGFGYVTKSGLLNGKDRDEQLIVYEVDGESDYYYIARCLMDDCEIAASGSLSSNGNMTQFNMEKPIKVKKDAVFSVKEIKGELIAEFQNVNDKTYTIKADLTENDQNRINGKLVPALHKFFET
jgi:hypothetical protein